MLAAAVGHTDDKMLATMRLDIGGMCMCVCSHYGCCCCCACTKCVLLRHEGRVVGVKS